MGTTLLLTSGEASPASRWKSLIAPIPDSSNVISCRRMITCIISEVLPLHTKDIGSWFCRSCPFSQANVAQLNSSRGRYAYEVNIFKLMTPASPLHSCFDNINIRTNCIISLLRTRIYWPRNVFNAVIICVPDNSFNTVKKAQIEPMATHITIIAKWMKPKSKQLKRNTKAESRAAVHTRSIKSFQFGPWGIPVMSAAALPVSMIIPTVSLKGCIRPAYPNSNLLWTRSPGFW